jgi:hypothetical protein
MSILSAALDEALQKRFPSVAVSPGSRFVPMLDLTKGEVSSTAAIEVARALRGDALAIAQDLLSDIAQQVPGDWKVVAGYMILTNAPAVIIREEARTRHELFDKMEADAPLRTIVCLVPDATSPVYARLRLIACSALQAVLAVAFEGRCRLGFEPEAPQVVASHDDVVQLTARAVERCFRHEGEARLGYTAPAHGFDTDSPLVVWTSHHYHDRLGHDVKRAFVEARASGGVFLKIPSDGWLLSRERALSELLSTGSLERVVRRLSETETWLRWIFHFASSIPSGDLDPAVALYDECASPRWTLQVLHHRVTQLISPILHGGDRELVEAIVARPLTERALLLRALFLPALTARAIREGEVVAWSTVIEEFASRAHAVLNAPHFRAALKNGAIDGELMQINAGLALGIAGILPAVTEGQCVNRQ